MYRDTQLAQKPTVTAKTAPYPPRTGTVSRLKKLDNQPVASSGNVYLLYCRAVSGHSSRNFKPSNPPWLLTFSSFNNDTLTGQFLVIWQLILPTLRLSSFLASFFQIPKQMQMALNSNMTNTLFIHLHLFSQMVTDPRQQILPGPICWKNLWGQFRD